MKVCYSCKVEKPLTDFGKCSKNKDGLYGTCKVCKRAYDNKFHKNRDSKTKQRKIELQKERLKVNRQFVYDYLKDNPCNICGESDPCVLEFDHINQDMKFRAVSNMKDFSLKALKVEISKCRVLCANCHKRHTAQQMGWYKDLVL